MQVGVIGLMMPCWACEKGFHSLQSGMRDWLAQMLLICQGAVHNLMGVTVLCNFYFTSWCKVSFEEDPCDTRGGRECTTSDVALKSALRRKCVRVYCISA